MNVRLLVRCAVAGCGVVTPAEAESPEDPAPGCGGVHIHLPPGWDVYREGRRYGAACPAHAAGLESP